MYKFYDQFTSQSLEANVENWISANTDETDKEEMELMIITDQLSWRNWWRGTSCGSFKKCGNLINNCYSSTENKETALQFLQSSGKCSVEAETNAVVKFGPMTRRNDSSNNSQNKMLSWVTGGNHGIYKVDTTHITISDRYS